MKRRACKWRRLKQAFDPAAHLASFLQISAHRGQHLCPLQGLLALLQRGTSRAKCGNRQEQRTRCPQLAALLGQLGALLQHPAEAVGRLGSSPGIGKPMARTAPSLSAGTSTFRLRAEFRPMPLATCA